jgi:NAD-dependent deacetylase
MHHPLDADELETALDQAAGALRRARRVAVLTGAGVSAESGVATFRGAGGLWEGHRVEEVATPEAFAASPELVWRFYNMRRAGLRDVQPNPGHHALVALERHYGDAFALVTQNVDGLHRAAGSRRVHEVHGNIRHVRCTRCAYRADRGLEELPDLPRCDQCGHLLRPDIVWFHEMLPPETWLAACRATEECHCFLVVGTSAVVYPAAGLIGMARAVGAVVVEVNLEATGASGGGSIGLYGPSGVLLPRLVEKTGLVSEET